MKRLLKQSLRSSRRRAAQTGITLIELLVVLAIISLLAGLVGPAVFNELGKARGKTARLQIQDLEQGLEMYKLDVGRFPSTADGLEALIRNPGNADGWNGPYLKAKEVPQDPWKNPYHYKYPGDHGGVDIVSFGEDGIPGGEGESADISNL